MWSRYSQLQRNIPVAYYQTRFHFFWHCTFLFICIHLVIVYIAGKYVPYVRNVSVVSILLLSRLTAPDPDETKYDHGERKKRKTFSKVLYCMAVVLMVWYVWCGGSWGCVRKTETMYTSEVSKVV